MNYVFNGSWDCEYDKITKLIIPKGSLDEGFFTHVLPRFTQLESLVRDGLGQWMNGRFALTPRGIEIQNDVLMRFME